MKINKMKLCMFMSVFMMTTFSLFSSGGKDMIFEIALAGKTSLMTELEEISKASFKLSQGLGEKFPGGDYKSMDGKVYPWISKAGIRIREAKNRSQLKDKSIDPLKKTQFSFRI